MHLAKVAILCSSLLLVGISSSLINSFFPMESLSRGVSLSQCGIIIGSKYLANVFSSFVVGNIMEVTMSTRSVLICGLLVICACNSLFSLLYFVSDPMAYMMISISLRIFLAFGETAVMISSYSQAAVQGGEDHQGKIGKRR